MGYRQTWYTSGEQLSFADACNKQWEVGACFGPMTFNRTNHHFVTQVVGPELRGKYIALLSWMQDYFVFSFDLLSKEAGLYQYETKQQQQHILADYRDHLVFLLSFKDQDFVSQKHRLLFLTLIRIAQEFPNVLNRWVPGTNFEGVLKACQDWYYASIKNKGDLKGPYTDTNTGHLLINYNTDQIKRWPSLETVLVYLHSNPETPIHALSAYVLKGNTKDV